MPLAKSRLTAQGQISVPVEVRRKLGVGPGSMLAWEEDGDRLVVRRAGRFSSKEIHDAVFGSVAAAASAPMDVKDGIRRFIRKRHARD